VSGPLAGKNKMEDYAYPNSSNSYHSSSWNRLLAGRSEAPQKRAEEKKKKKKHAHQ